MQRSRYLVGRVLRVVSAHFGPQMFRAPTTDLRHFEHVFLAPTHTQSESLMHPLSLPWRFGDQGQSYVAGLRDSREMGPSTPSIDSGSVDAYVPGMGKQLDGCCVVPLAQPPAYIPPRQVAASRAENASNNTTLLHLPRSRQLSLALPPRRNRHVPDALERRRVGALPGRVLFRPHLRRVGPVAVHFPEL